MIITRNQAVELVAGQLMVRLRVAETLLVASEIEPIQHQSRCYFDRDQVEAYIDRMPVQLVTQALRPDQP